MIDPKESHSRRTLRIRASLCHARSLCLLLRSTSRYLTSLSCTSHSSQLSHALLLNQCSRSKAWYSRSSQRSTIAQPQVMETNTVTTQASTNRKINSSSITTQWAKCRSSSSLKRLCIILSSKLLCTSTWVMVCAISTSSYSIRRREQTTSNPLAL